MSETLPPKELEEKERSSVLQRTAPRALVVYEAIRREGEDELGRTSSALAWSGLAAGLSMGFSLLTQAILASGLPEAGWSFLITKLGYSAGFLIVILGRQQLFTENTLTPMLQLLVKPSASTFLQVLRLWSVVLATNLAGGLIFALLLFYFDIVPASVVEQLRAISHQTIRGDDAVFTRAIFGGWLIALMVWLLPFAEVARVLVIVFVTYLVGIGHFPHIVAGSIDVFYAMLSGQTSWLAGIGSHLLPTLLGNIVGGVALVALINHGQVAADTRER